jgi:cytochrome c biogenesis protein CcdA
VVALITLSPLGLAAAFGAGFLSFVSPCVWP